MSSDDSPSQRCELCAVADLLAALDEHMIKHLEVNESHTFVLYGEAILDLRVPDGTLSAARGFTVASRGFARRAHDPDPAAVITEFCRGLVAAIETERR